MKRNHFKLIFLIILIYTLFALVPIAKTGGACNGELAYVVLGPIIIMLTILQYLIFRKLINSKNKINLAKKLLSISCSLLWAFWTYVFSIDSFKEGLLYFFPFLLLNIFVTILTFKPDLIE